MSWTSSSAPVEIAVKGTPFTNTAPTVATGIEDQTATEGQTFSFAFPDTTFEDDDGDTLTYTATLDDDTALPSWLSFDAANRSFSGTPQAGDGGTITVKVTATDSADAEVSDEFDIKVGTPCAAPDFGTRRRIWTGTVTVGEQENLIYGTTYGYGSDTSPAFGNLSDTDFEIGSNNYTIRVIYINDNLNFEITTPGPNAVEEAALKLHVCDTTAYNFSAAGKAGGPGFSEVAYYWSSPPDWSSESTRTLYLSLPANNAATGLPTITSSAGATVGDALTANQGIIADSDGLPATFPEDYTLQWVREDEDGMNAEDITGETSGTYELADDDVGKKVRVRVSFTDQLSGMETVTSDPFPASGTVVDNRAPVVTITDVPATSNGPFTATITFDEVVSGLTVGDITVSSNARLSAFRNTTTGTVWKVVVTPTATGTVTLNIAANVADDGAGNGNTAAAQVSSIYTAPAPPPGVAIWSGTLTVRQLSTIALGCQNSNSSRRCSDGAVLSDDDFEWNGVDYNISTFNYVLLTDFGGEDTLNIRVSLLPDEFDETSLAVTVDGQVVVVERDDVRDIITDTISSTALTNSNPDFTWTAGQEVEVKPFYNDVTAPTVMITDVPGTSNGPFTATITFSEPVDGFELTDIDVSDNATLSDFETVTAAANRIWTVEVTLTMNGAVTLDIPAGAAMDAAGNGNTAAAQASSTYTAPPMIVSIAGGSPVDEGTAALFTLTRTGITTAALTVDVTVTGDVLAGTAPTEVTFGANLSTATLSVATQDDDVDEGDSMVTATVVADGDTPAIYEVGSPSQATVTVSDDDEREVVVSGSPVVVNEGGTGAYRVVLRSQPTGEVTITPSSDNSDVTFMPTTLTFTADDWSTAQDVMVTAAQDADDVNDNATISHTVAGADYGDNSVTAASVAVTVSEVVLPVVTIAAGTSPVSEGTAAVFTLTRTGNMTNGLTVGVAVAETGAVLAGAAPTSVTFDAGAATAALSVATEDDEVDEDAGMVTATVAPDSAAPPTYVLGTPASASVAANDNDATPVVMLLLSPDTIAEAAGMSEIQATLSNPSAVETRVTVSLPAEVAGAVELDADPPVLVILAKMTDSSNAVTLTAVDNDAEAPDLSVTISGMAENTVGVTDPEPVTLTITDDDGTAPMDTTAPRVASIEGQIPGASPTNADSLTWRITFSETVVNVDTADFTVSGSTATVTNVEPVGGKPLAYDVTVSSGDLANFNGTVTLGFASDQNIADGANRVLNNTMPTETNDNSYQVDHAAPRVEINVPATSTAPFTATITFNEMVSGFMQSDIMVSSNNATLSGFTEATTEEAAPGTVWTVLVTPEMDGAVTLDMAADVAMDAAGNGNTAAPTASSTYRAAPVNEEPSSTTLVTEEPSIPPPLRDTTAPRVASILRQAPTTSPTNADSLTWRVTFSETVLNVDRLDFTVSGSTATVTNVEPVGGEPLAYDVTVSGGDLASFNGTVTLGFASDQNIADGANRILNNTRPTETNDNSYMVDNAAPTVGIGGVPATSAAPFTATITFNEVVSGFMVDDIMVVNATLSDFTEATTGTVWTVLVTPTADGRVTLTIPANVTEDAVGNGNTAALQARSIYTAPDTTAPTVGIDVPAMSHVPFTATITFSEMVSGFTVDDIMVSSNAILSDFTEATTGEGTTGTVWTVLVTPEMDGAVTLDMAADVAMDAAGNGNTAATQARSTYTAPAMEIEAKEEAEAVLKEVVLPEVVQQLTAETTEVITSRLNTIASGAPGAPPALSLEDVVADTVAAFHGERERLKGGSLEWGQVLSGRDFVLPLSSLDVAQGENTGAQDNPFSTLAVWGGGNYSSYRNIIENTDVDGNGFSAVIGMDLQPIPRLVTGLALTTSRWGLDYATNANDASAEGTYKIGITMVNPYVNWWATEHLSLWATVGHGRGKVEQTPEGDDATTRTDALTSWAGGVRFEVLPAMDPLTGQGSPFGLAFKADGATSGFLDTQVQLARLAAEVSRSFAVENGLLTTALDLGWRIRSVSGKDDVDVQQQAIADKNSSSGGAELAGSLNWLNTDGSVSATVDTRVLLGGGHHREWGIGGHLRLTPSRRDGEGLSLTLQPSFGATGTRLDELWSLAGNSDLAINNDHPNARLDARLAYGFRHGDALFTPYTEVMWEEAASTYGAGLRYGLNAFLELDLKGAQRNGANGHTENRFSLDVRSDL